MSRLKVALIAKPWHGGLFQYYLNAFKRNKYIDAKIFFSYPGNYYEYFLYKKNKIIWYEKLIEKINLFKYDVGFFINYSPFMENLSSKKNILYLTDAADLSFREQHFFGGIFISDSGYKEKVDKNLFLGELPFAHDPEIHKPVRYSGKKKAICSIMNQDLKRDRFLNEIKPEYFPEIYGNYFLKHSLCLRYPFKFFPSINFNNQNKIYSKYLISLNIHSNVIKSGTNQRIFEAAACRIPQLTNYSNGLENFFEPDNDIYIFSSADEYYEKYDVLIKDKKIRNRMIENSYKRAKSSHAYDHRINKIINLFI